MSGDRGQRPAPRANRGRIRSALASLAGVIAPETRTPPPARAGARARRRHGDRKTGRVLVGVWADESSETGVRVVHRRATRPIPAQVKARRRAANRRARASRKANRR